MLLAEEDHKNLLFFDIIFGGKQIIFARYSPIFLSSFQFPYLLK